MYLTLQQLNELTDHDLSGSSNYQSKYLKGLQKRALKAKSSIGSPSKSSLKNMIENDKVDDGFKEILSNILTVNPYFRWTASECLAHPMFDDFRIE